MTNQPVLYRPRDGAVVAGVCAGLARRYRIDPVVVRVLAVALCFAGGFGVALYVAGVITIPRDGRAVAPVGRLLPFTQTWSVPVLWLAMTVVIMVAVGVIGGWNGIGIVPVVIIALVYAVSRHHGKNAQARVSAPEPTPFERAADAWQQRVDAHRQGLVLPDLTAAQAVPPQAAPPTLPVPAEAPKRGHGWLIAFGLMIVGLGVMTMLHVCGLEVPPAAFLAVITLSFGIALLANVRRGRPRGMTVLAILAAIATPFAFVGGSASAGELVEYSDGVSFQVGGAEPEQSGDLTVFSQAGDVRGPIDAGLGDQTYDFSGIALTEDLSTTIAMDAGNLHVLVPVGYQVDIDWAVQFGDASWSSSFASDPQGDRGGVSQSGTVSFPAQSDAANQKGEGPHRGGHQTPTQPDSLDAPTLHLTLTVGAGDLEVTR